MEKSNLSDAEFKTLFIKILKELSEDLNSIKNIQSKMKDTLIEIKTNLEGNNSGADEVKNQISVLEHKEAKKKNPVRRARRKQNPKKKK